MAKDRTGPDNVEAFTLVGDVANCTAIMVDDLTTTASTICCAAKLLMERKAKAVYAAVSHATITKKGLERLKNSDIEELVVTDSVPLIGAEGYPVTVLSVAELLGEAIMRIHDDRSVTSLFRL